MAQTVKLKRSAVSGNVPTTSDLALGEIAINTYDGNIFIKKNDGSESIVTFSAGGNAGSIEEDSFTGNGNTTAFTISTAPSTEENLLVFIDAAFQNRDSFTVSGTTVTFDTAPDNGSSVRIYHVIPGSVDDGILTVAKFAASAIVTEAEGISSNDNDTTLPTSAAVKDYVDTQVATVDTLPEVLANGNTTGGTDIAVSAADDITFTDTSKAIFGDGSDLQIYHDGSHSYIKENGVGNLFIDATSLRFRTGAGTETYLTAEGNGAVTLYYDNTAVLATTADGISVTSEVEASEFIGDLRGAVLFKAQAGENVTKGDVVYISGISGNTTVVSKADADDASKMPAFGIVAATTTSGQPVDIYTQGILGDLDTSSYSEGDELFVSTTAGALTDTAPTGETALLQKIAKVTRSNATSGSIFITGAGRTNAVPNLDEDQFFLGNASNQAVATDFSDSVESYLDGGTSTPTFSTLAAGNTTLTGYLRGPSSFTIDPATHGDDTGTVVIAGNLQVDGTTTTINSTTLTVDDKLITLASGSINAAAADGAGIEVDGASATFTYDSTNDRWDLNKDISADNGFFFGSQDFYLYRSAADIATLRVGDSGSYKYFSFTDTGTVARFSSASGAVSLGSGANDHLLINSSGNVGIGLDNPSEKLHIYGTGATISGKVEAGDGNQASFDLKNSEGEFRLINDGGELYVYDSTDAAERFRIDTSGNVGIGTSDPNRELELSAANPRFRMTDTDGGYAEISGNTGHLALQADVGNTQPGSRIDFEIDGGSQMRLLTSGLGIGTTAPSEKLGVAPDTDVSAEIGRAHIGAVGHNDYAAFSHVDRDATNSYALLQGAAGETYLNSASGQKLRFRINNSNVAEFDSSGNFAIGVTNPSAKFQVEEYGIDTTETSTTATTQVAIHTFAAATFRSARFTIQVTNSTDSTYHLTEILMIHDGTTPSITEYGTIFTGAAAEATFDADISSGNVRLLATPASTDTMEFKVVSHSITT